MLFPALAAGDTQRPEFIPRPDQLPLPAQMPNVQDKNMKLMPDPTLLPDLPNMEALPSGLIDAAGARDLSGEEDTILLLSVPQAPNIWASYVYPNQITLNWTAGGQHYNVFKWNPGGYWENIYFNTGTSYTDYNVTSGQWYFYTAASWNGTSWSPFSFNGGYVAVYNTPNYPGSQIHYTVTSTSTSNTLTIQQAGSLYLFYKLVNGSWQQVQYNTSNTYTDYNVISNQANHYSAWVYNGGWKPSNGQGNSYVVTPASSPPYNGVVLGRGLNNNSSDVQLIQNRLNQLGYTDYNGSQLVVDGTFGENTEIAVKNFKHKNGLQNSSQYFGQVEEQTWYALFSDSAIRNNQGFGTSEAAPYGNLGWVWPMSLTSKPVSLYHGWRNYNNQYHKGFDIASPKAPVYSVADGNIIEKGWYTNGGNGLALETNKIDPGTGNKLIVRYLHLDSYSTAIANAAISRNNPFPVSQSQEIATSGNTGGGNIGYHLHFDVNKADKTGKDATIVFADTINPHWFYPALPLYGKLHPDFPPQGMSFLSEEDIYDDQGVFFSYIIIDHVGKESFFNWINQTSYDEQTIANFKSFFSITDEAYIEIVGE